MLCFLITAMHQRRPDCFQRSAADTTHKLGQAQKQRLGVELGEGRSNSTSKLVCSGQFAVFFLYVVLLDTLTLGNHERKVWISSSTWRRFDPMHLCRRPLF